MQISLDTKILLQGMGCNNDELAWLRRNAKDVEVMDTVAHAINLITDHTHIEKATIIRLASSAPDEISLPVVRYIAANISSVLEHLGWELTTDLLSSGRSVKGLKAYIENANLYDANIRTYDQRLLIAAKGTEAKIEAVAAFLPELKVIFNDHQVADITLKMRTPEVLGAFMGHYKTYRHSSVNTPDLTNLLVQAKEPEEVANLGEMLKAPSKNEAAIADVVAEMNERAERAEKIAAAKTRQSEAAHPTAAGKKTATIAATNSK